MKGPRMIYLSRRGWYDKTRQENKDIEVFRNYFLLGEHNRTSLLLSDCRSCNHSLQRETVVECQIELKSPISLILSCAFGSKF